MSSRPSSQASSAGSAGIGDLGHPALLGQQLAQPGRGQVVAEQVVAQRPVDALAELDAEVGALRQPGQVDARLADARPAPRRAGRPSRAAAAAARRPRPACSRRPTTETTTPAIGALTVVSIFIDSSTAIGSPAATCMPGWACTATTSAGQPARTTMPSSRSTRWAPPSVSMRQPVSVAATSSRCRRPPQVMRRSQASRGIDGDVGARAAVADRVVARPHAVDVQAVADAAVGQHDARADRGGLLRPAARRRGEESRLGAARGRLRRPRPRRRAARPPALPHRVRRRARRASQRSSTAPRAKSSRCSSSSSSVRLLGPAVDHDRGALERPAQPSQRQGRSGPQAVTTASSG